MAKYGDERIQQIITMTDARGDFGPLEDGYQYYWTKHGACAAYELRVLADELDRRNALWDAEVQKALGSINNSGLEDITGERLQERTDPVAQLDQAALERMARAYMRLQCADVPRDPWHWEVCKILNETGSLSRPENLSPGSAPSDTTKETQGEPK